MFKQLDLALAHFRPAAGIDGCDVGLVDPLEAAVGGAKPAGIGQRIEEGAPGDGIAHQLAMLIENLGQVLFAAGDGAGTAGWRARRRRGHPPRRSRRGLS